METKEIIKMKKQNKKIKFVVFSQLIILIMAIFATSFLISQTIPLASATEGDSPIIRRIPAGVSTDPRDQQRANSLIQMSKEEIEQLEKNLQIAYEKGKIEFEKKDLSWENTLGMSLGSVLIYAGLKGVFASSASGVIQGSFLLSKVYSIVGSTIGSAVATFAAAFAGAQITLSLFKLFGTGSRNLQAGQTGALIGAGAGGVLGMILIYGSAGISLGPAAWIATAVAAIITSVYMIFSYKKYSQEVFTYSVGLWQPKTKGENCLQCNNLPFGCSQYQCKTYGAGCILINPDSKDQMCIWNNSNDMNPPIITFDPESLPSEEYSYSLTQTGATIFYEGGNLPAFSGLTFGIKTNMLAQCAYDTEYEYGETLEEMAWMTNMGSTSFLESHFVYISNKNFLSEFSLNNIEAQIEPDKEYNFYFMCKSVNGQLSSYPFLVTFKIGEGPDTSPPKIISTDPLNNSYVRFTQNEQKLTVITNEPANCSWSFTDKDYFSMEYKMQDCSQNIQDVKYLTNYGCTTNLVGLKLGLNLFYIRCIDKPTLDTSNEQEVLKSGGNRVNTQSYVYYLTKTNELIIDKIIVGGKIAYSPENGSKIIEFRNSTQPISLPISVLTKSGAKNGEAICSYKRAGTSNKYIFYNGGTYGYLKENKDNFIFLSGNNQYTIECCDVALNCDTKEINLKLEVDTIAPEISRVYKQDGQIKIITNEKSTCVYSKSTCNYLIKDGLNISSFDGIEHSLNWDTESNYYIKCSDDLGNSLGPNQCQMILRASQLYSL